MNNMIRKFIKLLMIFRMKYIYSSSIFMLKLKFDFYGVKYGQNPFAIGHPRIHIDKGGECSIGDNFKIRTGLFCTEVGSVGSRILVGPKGKLTIGNNVGMSNATIVAQDFISIGNNVKIGGGVQIFDTNFHSTDPAIRCSGRSEPPECIKKKPVIIGNNVFIGTNAIICKGVTIEDNAMVPAGMVVYKDFPDKVQQP